MKIYKRKDNLLAKSSSTLLLAIVVASPGLADTNQSSPQVTTKPVSVQALVPMFYFYKKTDFGIFDQGVSVSYILDDAQFVTVSYTWGVPFQSNFGSLSDVSSRGKTHRVRATYSRRPGRHFFVSGGAEYQRFRTKFKGNRIMSHEEREKVGCQSYDCERVDFLRGAFAVETLGITMEVGARSVKPDYDDELSPGIFFGVKFLEFYMPIVVISKSYSAIKPEDENLARSHSQKTTKSAFFGLMRFFLEYQF